MMARVTDKELQELQVYGYSIGLTESVMHMFKPSYKKYVTREQLNALLQCQNIMKASANRHHIEKYLAPKHPKREAAKLKKLLDEAKTDDEKELILSEWKSFSYHKSIVKEFKQYIMDEAREILKASEMGHHKREEALALLFTVLADKKNLTTEKPPIPKFAQNLKV